MPLNALVVTGHGINCEIETRRALEIVGFNKIDLAHLNFIVGGEVDIGGYQLIVFPGGFSGRRRSRSSSGLCKQDTPF